MSFQGYLKTIKEKTGKYPVDFRNLADQKKFTTAGKLNDNVKAAEIVA